LRQKFSKEKKCSTSLFHIFCSNFTPYECENVKMSSWEEKSCFLIIFKNREDHKWRRHMLLRMNAKKIISSYLNQISHIVANLREIISKIMSHYEIFIFTCKCPWDVSVHKLMTSYSRKFLGRAKGFWKLTDDFCLRGRKEKFIICQGYGEVKWIKCIRAWI
jgi:hypothetical protein